jgi:hypothetical protein
LVASPEERKDTTSLNFKARNKSENSWRETNVRCFVIEKKAIFQIEVTILRFSSHFVLCWFHQESSFDWIDLLTKMNEQQLIAIQRIWVGRTLGQFSFEVQNFCKSSLYMLTFLILQYTEALKLLSVAHSSLIIRHRRTIFVMWP